MRTLSVSLILVVLIATIGLGWIFDTLYLSYQQEQETQSNDTSLALENIAVNLATSISGLQDKQGFIAQWQGDYTLQLIKLDDLALPSQLKETLISGTPLTLESSDQVTIHVKLPESDELLLLNFQQVEEFSVQDNHRYWLTVLFYAMLIGAFLIWLAPLAQRLFKLRRVAKAFGEGKLNERIQVGSISYIRDVEYEFNRMAQRIEDLVADVKLLSSAVSHDLRTPLAKLRMGLDTLSEETDPQVRANYHQRLDKQMDNMVELVETLLQYARMDQAMIELQNQPLNIEKLILHSLNQHAINAEFLSQLNTSQTMVYGDGRYLKIAINNLLQNACKYGKSRIRVVLDENADWVILTIEDDGCGIPEDQRERIFKPFVRANNHSEQGFGVGLAMVKRVLDWHHASVSVGNSATLRGAKFEVKLKKAQ